jgi:hypothetical protein
LQTCTPLLPSATLPSLPVSPVAATWVIGSPPRRCCPTLPRLTGNGDTADAAPPSRASPSRDPATQCCGNGDRRRTTTEQLSETCRSPPKGTRPKAPSEMNGTRYYNLRSC